MAESDWVDQLEGSGVRSSGCAGKVWFNCRADLAEISGAECVPGKFGRRANGPWTCPTEVVDRRPRWACGTAAAPGELALEQNSKVICRVSLVGQQFGL